MAQPLLTNNSPSAGYIAWTATGMTYDGKGYSVTAGNTNKRYVIWRIKDAIAPVLEMTDEKPDDMVAGDTILFVNRNGMGAIAAGTAMIDGSLIVQGTITADEIQALSIETRHLQADSVQAKNLAAGSVTAEKLSVGTLSGNLVANGGFEDIDAASEIAAWEYTAAPVNGEIKVANTPGSVASGKNSIVLVPATTTANVRFGQKLSHAIPVSDMPGTRLYVAVVAGMGGVAITNGFNVRVKWFGRDGMPLTGAAAFTDVQSNIGLNQQFIRYEDQVTPPAGARYLALEIFLLNPSAVSNVHLDEVEVRQVIVSTHIGDGAITTTKIKAGAVVTDHLAANVVTADKIVVSDWTNYAHGGNFDKADDLLNWLPTSGLSIVSTGQHAGSGCLQGNANAAVRSMLMRDMPNVLAGEKYLISFQFKSTADWNGTGGNSKVRIGDQAGALIDAPVYGAASTTWKPIQKVVTIPAGMTNMQVAVVFDHTVGTAWIDSLQIRRMEAGELVVDGAIVGKHISAGSISTDKLSVGTVGDSLVTNGSFEEFENGMAVGWRAIAATNGFLDVNTAAATSGKYALALGATVAGNANLRVEQTPDRFIPVSTTSGRRWYISCRAAATAATTSGFYIRVNWYDGNKAYLSFTDLRSNGSIGNTFFPYEGQVAPAANARYMAVNIFFINPNVVSTLYVDEIIAREVVYSAVIGDGQITTAKLVANSITADKMLIADTTNFWENPDFEGDTVGGLPRGTTLTSTANSRVLGAGSRGSAKSLELNALSTGNNDVFGNNIFPVTPGDKFYVQMDYKFLNGVGTSNAGVGFRTYGPTKAGVTWTGVAVANTRPTVWQEGDNAKKGVYTVPAGTYYLQPWVTFGNNAETTNRFHVDNIIIRRMNGGELIVDGAINGQTITGATIQTATSGARIVMDSTGLKAWDANNINYLTADSTGLTQTGVFKTLLGDKATYLQVGDTATGLTGAGPTGVVGGVPGVAFLKAGRSYAESPRIFSYSSGEGIDIRAGGTNGSIAQIGAGTTWVGNGTLGMSVTGGLSADANVTLKGGDQTHLIVKEGSVAVMNSGGTTVPIGNDTGWIQASTLGAFSHRFAFGWEGVSYRAYNGMFIIQGSASCSSAWVIGDLIASVPAKYNTPTFRIMGSNAYYDPATDGIQAFHAGGAGGNISFSVSWPLV